MEITNKKYNGLKNAQKSDVSRFERIGKKETRLGGL
jgi:hypothetical protein